MIEFLNTIRYFGSKWLAQSHRQSKTMPRLLQLLKSWFLSMSFYLNFTFAQLSWGVVAEGYNKDEYVA